MRKKEILCLLISFVMLLTSLVPVTVAADDSASIFDTYTFEEFIGLSEEEICAISDEIAEAYEEGVSGWWDDYNLTNSDAGGIYICVMANASYPTAEDFKTALMLPENIHTMPEDLVNNYYAVGIGYNTFYREYEPPHLIGAINAWINANPVVTSAWVQGRAIAEPDPKVTTTTTTTTTTEPPVITAVEGDTNLDGKLSVVDVITLSKYNAKILTLNEAQLLACDCNGDGVVDNGDVIDLMKFIVGIYDALPMAG